MKNILVITNIYPMPDPSYEGTQAVHYFTKEWVEMGYNVKVVHIKAYFPRIFYFFGKFFKNLIKAKTGSIVHIKRLTKCEKYYIDKVPVLLIPVFKLYPHAKFSNNRINNALDFIINENKESNFEPDYAIGHFRNPQLQILHLLKEKYSKIKTCMVLHCNGSLLKKIYPKQYLKYIESIDVWGFRSLAFKTGFENIYNVKTNNFLCYSGIPNNYLNFINRSFKNKIDQYCFVGSLYKLKRIENTIVALNNAYTDKSFQFHIVGDGAEMKKLKNLTKALNIEQNVLFYGKLSRDSAQKIMANSDYFVMVSNPEAFGLVYIEAMAKGCITIGTKKQGIDGVIKHKYNGFLCEANNTIELENLIKDIQVLDYKLLQKISLNGFETALKMTNHNAALHYINSVINLSK